MGKFLWICIDLCADRSSNHISYWFFSHSVKCRYEYVYLLSSNSVLHFKYYNAATTGRRRRRRRIIPRLASRPLRKSGEMGSKYGACTGYTLGVIIDGVL